METPALTVVVSQGPPVSKIPLTSKEASVTSLEAQPIYSETSSDQHLFPEGVNIPHNTHTWLRSEGLWLS